MIPIVALTAVVLHGNTSATKLWESLAAWLGMMPIYGIVRIWHDCPLKSHHDKPKKTLLFSVTIRDRRGSATCSLALSINSRGFCKERQSLFSSSVILYTHFSLSLSLLDACFVLGFIISIHLWSRVWITPNIFRIRWWKECPIS